MGVDIELRLETELRLLKLELTLDLWLGGGWLGAEFIGGAVVFWPRRVLSQVA